MCELCCPSSLCAGPPPGAGALHWVTWAGGGVSAQNPPSPSPLIPAFLVPSSPFPFCLYFYSLNTAESSALFSSDSPPTHTHPCLDKHNLGVSGSGAPHCSGSGRTLSLPQPSHLLLAFSFRAGAWGGGGVHQEPLSQGCHPRCASESPVQLHEDCECPGETSEMLPQQLPRSHACPAWLRPCKAGEAAAPHPPQCWPLLCSGLGSVSTTQRPRGL